MHEDEEERKEVVGAAAQQGNNQIHGRALRSRIFASRTGQGVPRAEHWCLGSGAIVSEG